MTPSASGSSTASTEDTSGEPPVTPADDGSGELPSTSTGTETSVGGTQGSIPRCEMPMPIPDGPDCTNATGVHEGSLILEEGMAAPEALVGIREVTGSVRINRLDITDLDFMQCLEVVGGDLTIFGNEQLTSVDGLWSLTEVGTRFVFTDNDALTEFDGLPNITTIGENLHFRRNAALTSIRGFQQLTELDNLTIQDNPVLSDIDGLGGLTTMTGNFVVTANPMLCISSVNCVGEGITMPAAPSRDWSTDGNDEGC